MHMFLKLPPQSGILQKNNCTNNSLRNDFQETDGGQVSRQFHRTFPMASSDHKRSECQRSPPRITPTRKHQRSRSKSPWSIYLYIAYIYIYIHIYRIGQPTASHFAQVFLTLILLKGMIYSTCLQLNFNWKTQNISNKYGHSKSPTTSLGYFICVLQTWQESNWVLKFP